jgi:hypothetical protein
MAMTTSKEESKQIFLRGCEIAIFFFVDEMEKVIFYCVSVRCDLCCCPLSWVIR